MDGLVLETSAIFKKTVALFGADFFGFSIYFYRFYLFIKDH